MHKKIENITIFIAKKNQFLNCKCKQMAIFQNVSY